MGTAISRVFGAKTSRTAPPRVPTDEVLPTYLFDDTTTLREYTLIWTFRFDEVLDAEKLNDALSRLFQKDGWRRLGGRLRLRPDGKAEIHVPQQFSAGRPPVYFTKEHHDKPMADHPLASKLPKATSGEPMTFPHAREFASLAVGPGAPRTIDDYFCSDAPLFALHVVTFTDGTLVSINFSHMVSDLSGLEAVLNAWQLVLAGKEDEVPEFVGYREDPMEPLYKPDQPPEKSLIDGSELRGWRLIVWGIRHMFEHWWNPLDSRMVCVPRKVIDAMIEHARSDITRIGGAGHDPKPFVSENDVLMSLCNKLMALAQPSSRTIVTLMAVDPRSRVKSVFREDAAYVANCPSAAFFRCTSGEASDMSLGELALRSREAVASQCTEEQLKAVAAFGYRSMMETGHPPLVGDTSSMLLVVSNQSKAAFYQKIDFSPAIVKPSQIKRSGAIPGHPVYHHHASLEKGGFATNVVVVAGRDLERNLWLSGDFPENAWTVLMESFKQYVA